MTKLVLQAQITEAGLVGSRHIVHLSLLGTAWPRELRLDVDEEVARACAAKVYSRVELSAEIEDGASEDKSVYAAERAVAESVTNAIRSLGVLALVVPDLSDVLRAAELLLQGLDDSAWKDCELHEQESCVAAVRGLAAWASPRDLHLASGLTDAAQKLEDAAIEAEPKRASREVVEKRLSALGWTQNKEHPHIWYGKKSEQFVVFEPGSVPEAPYVTLEMRGVPDEVCAEDSA